FFQAEDGIRDDLVTGVQTCALPIYPANFKVRAKELSPGQEVDRGEYLIRTTLAKHDIPCIAYSIEEKERPGRFHPEKAKRLGVRSEERRVGKERRSKK